MVGAVLVVLIAALLGAGYVFLALRYSYSRGDRAGYVQKFSKRGVLCKTWEGELAVVDLPGAKPETFAFTVRSDAVAGEINNRLGQRIVLTYEEHGGLPGCFGQSPYFVTAVRPAKP